MTNMHVLIPFTDALWIYTYCSYVRTVPITFSASRFEE